MDQPLTVFGYHGTSARSAEMILKIPGERAADRFVYSENDNDWLGDGAYFFQDAPYRAREWPTIRMPPPRRTPHPVVIRAEIELADCLDLLDIEAAKEVAEWYPQFELYHQKIEQPLPINEGGKREFDCAFINYAVERMEFQGRRINSVRAAFTEGDPIIPGSQLHSHSHVQIIVRPYRMEMIKDVKLYTFRERGQ